MKRFLLALLVSLALQTQAQINLCDSITVSGTQNLVIFTSISVIDYWITTAPNGTVLGEDSLWNQHSAINYNPTGSAYYDTIITCLSIMNTTCCVTWIWDVNLGVWAKMASLTSIGEIGSLDKKLIKVVDVLGRETSINSNQNLFFIYEDGTIEKRYIMDRK